jgi:hypothetical protein
MKSFILAVALFFGVFIDVASAIEPVTSFEQIVTRGKGAVDQSTLVLFNKGKSTWHKRKYTISNIKYDVKKTDSLVSPIVALVTFDLAVEHSVPFQTKEEADAVTDYTEFKMTNGVTLNYALTSGVWVFKGGMYDLTLSNEKMPSFTGAITPGKLKPETEPVHWAVIRFLP